MNYLPDFVYFNHSIHVNKGVGCASCHGPVDTDAADVRGESLQMEWCLNCHRAPEKFLRPRDQVFNMKYEQPSADHPVTLADGAYVHRPDCAGHGVEEPLQRSHGQDITSCNTCHR